MPCSLTTLVASAKLVIWEHKSSLSFTELFAHCCLLLHLTLLQRLHLRILQRTAVVRWGKTGCSLFPRPALSPWANQRESLLWKVLAKFVRNKDLWKLPTSWSPSVPADPAQRLLSMTQHWVAAFPTSGTTQSWITAEGCFCISCFLKFLSYKDFVLCLIFLF